TTGLQGIRVARDLWDYFSIARSAASEADLQRAVGCLARAVAVTGVTAFIGLLGRAAGKGLKVLRRGKLAGRTEVWWKADDFGPDYPGTAIPQGFTLQVGTRTFTIKPNATKHMAEYVRGKAGVGAFAAGTEFPISSLAGALEHADESGQL